MKRKDIQALLDKDPETVFFVEEYRNHTSAVLIVGFKESHQGSSRWSSTKHPARALTRSIRLGAGKAFYGYHADDDRITDEWLTENGVEQRDGYYLARADQELGYNAGQAFGKIVGHYAGTLADYVEEKWTEKHVEDANKRLNEERRLHAAQAGAALALVIRTNAGLDCGVEEERGLVRLTLTAGNAEVLAEAIKARYAE